MLGFCSHFCILVLKVLEYGLILRYNQKSLEQICALGEIEGNKGVF